MNRLIVAVAILTVFLISGCGPAASKSQDVKGPSPITPAEQEDSRETTEGSAGSRDSVPDSEKGEAQDTEGDLVIKSENQVTAGSKQELVEQIDKEVDDLVESLNNLDTIEDSELQVDIE
ncbi:MAG: hypothetical protein CVU89_01705 [Firmicutes bacterium HGW-Firmicutes-14]|nr:MAG: hypothetical protein CVU89_01705 [Firmicutes bacterium HGW-Firmicutes-14]